MYYNSKIHTFDIFAILQFVSDVISKNRANSAKLSAFSDLATPIYPKNAPTI